MGWKTAFFFLLIVFITINCSKKNVYIAPERARILQPDDIEVFHPEVIVRVGWVPYQDQKMIQTDNNEWQLVSELSDGKTGKVPVIFIESPRSEEPLLVDMSIENKLLGKLIKHSAITQQPIERPFTQFFEKAKCQNCHPEHIEVDFER
jgi:hypothetical protein